jgi:hypothetical protein
MTDLFTRKSQRQVVVHKNKRYREAQKAKGCCPHCGKPCAPYYECEERRAYKMAHRRARRLALGPIVSASGQWIAAHSNKVVPSYTAKPDDVRRQPREHAKRYRPTSSIPFDEMNEEQQSHEIMSLLSFCPMTEDEVEEFLLMKQLLLWRNKVLADPSRSRERWFVRTVVREAISPCIAVLRERGLNIGQIVAMLQAPWWMVRYYWMKCEAAQPGPTSGKESGEGG